MRTPSPGDPCFSVVFPVDKGVEGFKGCYLARRVRSPPRVKHWQRGVWLNVRH